MGKPLSMDLRSRALASVDEGMSCRAAASRFGVSASTVSFEAHGRAQAELMARTEPTQAASQ